MSDPEKPEAGEPTEGGERTRESEIKTNVEFWKDLGVEVDEADIRAKIEKLPEVEGFDFYLYIPQGIKTSEIWQKMSERFPIWKHDSIYDTDKIESSRTNEKDSYVIACRYQQEPDEDTLGSNAKSSLDWEKTKEQFMSPTERMVADMRWHKENKNHLDEKKITISPGSRNTHDRLVPALRYIPGNGKVNLYSSAPEIRNPLRGVRRVITKDTKV